ncbi:MAG: hypothetical protein HXY34_05140 [Candidatus Thorarchaeota archaeon]|nr:hypothetical protein [Candidatus Thorarchaeota archaeon]
MVLELAESIRTGKTDALEYRLTEHYRALCESAACVDSRIDVDEVLNSILTAKVTRVEEIARVIGTPEVYVNRIKALSASQLAGLIAYRSPVVMHRLDREGLERSLERLTQLIDAHGRPRPADPVPLMSGLPNDFKFTSEESVFLADLEAFKKRIPKGMRLSVAEVVKSDDFDEFLRRFLFVIVLVARGMVDYDPVTKTLKRV